MSPMMYQELINQAETSAVGKDERGQALAFAALSDVIDSMSHPERIELRDALTKLGVTKQLQNLYYDYDKQVWIEPAKAGA